MNEKAAEVLVSAALAGVSQTTGVFVSGRARCALGVLGEAAGLNLEFVSDYPSEIFDLYELRARRACPACSACSDVPPFPHEAALIVHLNDGHGWDFLTIARKVDVTDGDA